jgi:uncharacterized membrane protein YfcA
MLDPAHLALLALLVFGAATLYSMVGHGGASAYLAAMALFGLAPEVMKPTALVLNILVSAIATVQFARAGRFSWRTFWPFALAAIPLAFVGGAITLPALLYRRIVGVVLVYAALRLWQRAGARPAAATRPAPLAAALPLGAGMGFLSGLTGVGGGIFLSPVLVLARWADVRTTAGVSAAFILVNSVAGLLGRVSSVRALPPGLPALALAAVAGGLIGSTLGSRRLPSPTLRRLLAAVLAIAAWKLFAVRI